MHEEILKSLLDFGTIRNFQFARAIVIFLIVIAIVFFNFSYIDITDLKKRKKEMQN